ncbi:methyltransferase [Haloglycomyces albus]|uniref:methyltransferase n=1 Tax=Haloglycomyces albus TaxID=526067 RepID=UPI00046D2467|nr:methyltransferase [Haloglycomyces albus]
MTGKVIDAETSGRLRTAWLRSGYWPEALRDRFGATAMSQADRGDYRAVMRQLGDGVQDTWVRWFTLGMSVSPSEARSALDPLTVDGAREIGLLTAELTSGWGLQFDPAGHAIFSDQLAGMRGARSRDHVLGIGGASRLLWDVTLRRDVASVLDVGTGSGIQAFHATARASHVTATDLSERALAFALLNAGVNDLEVDWRQGDLIEPVAGRTFDQVIANPPFVVGTPGEGWTHRDGGRAADAIGAELAASAPTVLNPGGTMQFLANWLHRKGEPWTERVGSWIPEDDVTAWVVQREVVDPLDYVRTWQADAGQQHDAEQAAEWLNWFDEREVEGIGFGFVNLRRTPGFSRVRCDDLRHAVAEPWSDLVERMLFHRLVSWEPDRLWNAALVLCPNVRLGQFATIGTDGWEVERQWIESHGDLGVAEEIDPLIVEFLGNCDGSVPVGALVSVFADAYGSDTGALYAGLFPVIKHFLESGYLTVASES